MSNQQKREVVEDGPQYRSVMMAPMMAPPPMPRSLARPQKEQSYRSAQAKESTIPAAVWKVAEIPSLPAEYILERTNVYVDCDCQEVASRVCECLRLESIAASCDIEDESLLKAETSDCVKFAVRLFKDNGLVVVEVQRMCGCSFSFREAARSILRSAKGVKNTVEKRRFTIPGSIPKDTSEEKQKRVDFGLQVAFNMIESDRLDTQLLGMESLEQISGACDCTCVTAKAILKGDCLDKIIISAQCDATEAFTDIEEHHFFVMKRRALGVLANSLEAVARSEKLSSLLSDTPNLRSDALLTSLITTLKQAGEQPHEASQAARCMQYLLIDTELEQLLSDLGILKAASSACKVGSTRNSLLERETKKLLTRLDERC